MKIIDISVSVDDKLPLWPNSSGFCFTPITSIDKKNPFNETHIEMNAHAGTHIDAPLHFIAEGLSIEKAPLDIFVGPSIVVDLPNAKEIGPQELEELLIPKGTKRVLFKTSNSKLWGSKKFKSNYVGLTADGAAWITRKEIGLVGIDYLSIAKFVEAVEVHKILLGKKIYILESLDLSKVKPGKYELICLPVKISGAEAAPTRAVLIKS